MKHIDKITFFLLCSLLVSCQNGSSSITSSSSISSGEISSSLISQSDVSGPVISSQGESSSEISSSQSKEKVRVTFTSDDNFTLDQYSYQVDYGSDLSVKINFLNGSYYESCSYKNSSYDEGNSILTLKNIIYPTRVSITYTTHDYGIFYDINGGAFKDGGEHNNQFTKFYDLSVHYRANTERGNDILFKKGYLLTGWNTSADGNGEHIGLGSKVTIEKNVPLTLYAEWKEALSSSYFTYHKDEDNKGIILDKYQGSETTFTDFVIPNEIDNLPVTTIADKFAKGLTIQHLYFPETLTKLIGVDFENCNIEEMTLCDTLEAMQEQNFTNPIKTWHINANSAPKFYPLNDNSYFVEDLDRLILASGKKKLLFFAGCSMSYGLNSDTIQQKYKDYQVLNLGVIGGTNAGCQFDMIAPYVEEGDIFIHAPEQGSECQLMQDINCENRMFIIVEGNYDLLTHVDMSQYPKSFTEFNVFCKNRINFEDCSYDDINEDYNEYGDIILDRPYVETESKSYDDFLYIYHYDYINEENMKRLADKYDLLKKQGATVYFSYAPFNSDALTNEMKISSVWDLFDTNVKTYLEKPYGYKVISSPGDYLYTYEYFYDHDYHLNEDGAKKRTEALLNDLEKVITD